ncbi:hypothetical protein BS47DRAFT_1402729 [Hydnum rufescens UP504]|uniref:Uncharacterized protein n=1 Tax=Hydnum rufescens UP504 TaxID=1448309 RepID=A0A9P6DG06_9AGAM|nr:hypothetical protein BS47DRAFT_1402729 [Hydnum rufescens UP504]
MAKESSAVCQPPVALVQKGGTPHLRAVIARLFAKQEDCEEARRREQIVNVWLVRFEGGQGLSPTSVWLAQLESPSSCNVGNPQGTPFEARSPPRLPNAAFAAAKDRPTFPFAPVSVLTGRVPSVGASCDVTEEPVRCSPYVKERALFYRRKSFKSVAPAR